MKKKENLTDIEVTQKSYYNNIAELYDKHYASPYALEYRHWVYDMVFNNMELKGKLALDAMCGGGEATTYLLKRGAKVVGLDISEECCKIYQQKFPQNKVICASILNTDFKDNYFDIIITDSLHHLHPNVEKGLIEIHRILKPDGYFCCWEPNYKSLFDLLRRLWYKTDPKFFEQNEQSIDISLFKRKFNNKFEIIKTVYGGNIAYLLVNSSMIFRIPLNIVKYYYKPLIFIEKILTNIQPAIFSLFVLCLLKKID